MVSRFFAYGLQYTAKAAEPKGSAALSHLKRENPLCRRRTGGPARRASFGKEHTVVVERPARARAEALDEILHRHAGALRARDGGIVLDVAIISVRLPSESACVMLCVTIRQVM